MNDSQKKVSTIIAGVIICANVILKTLGYDFGIEDEAISAAVSAIVDVVCIIWVAWHNWNATSAAKVGQEVTDALKRGNLTPEQVGKMIDAIRAIINNNEKDVE